MVHTLDLALYLRKELEKIPEILKDYAKNPPNIEIEELRAPIIATGAGDSWVVAKALHYLSKSLIIPADPYELQIFLPKELEGTLIAISVKGETKAVVNSAKKLRERGWKVIAITANPTSALARISHITVPVRYGGGSVPVGVGNFISAVLSAASVIGYTAEETLPDMEVYGDPASIITAASTIYTAGEGVMNVAAEFISLKLHEALCRTSLYAPIEQLLHAYLYGIGKGGGALLFGGSAKSVKAFKILQEGGVQASLIKAENLEGLNTLISAVHKGIEYVADAVKELGVKEPCFLTRKELVELSTPEIYGGGAAGI